jgi:hypothetical protein
MEKYERPIIWVDDGELHRHVDESIEALAAWEAWATRVGADDTERVRVRRREDQVDLVRVWRGGAQKMNTIMLRDCLSRAAGYARITAAGRPKPVYPPTRVASVTLRAGEYPGIPVLGEAG